MSDTRTKVIVGAVAAIGSLTAAGIAKYWYTKKTNDDAIPTQWTKVGQIIDLNMFPVKSCAAVKCQSFYCHTLGFEWNSAFDRCFVVTENNQAVTGLTYPKMALIQPYLVENQLQLTAPGQPVFVLDLDELRGRSIDTKVQLWISQANGIVAGDKVADWLSQFIVHKPGVFRLIFYPYMHPTKVINKFYNYKNKIKSNDIGAYHSECSYMLINQASIDELNTRLDHVASPLQFRPNIVINGPKPYEEDNFKWIRIGENVIFRCLKPCFRCIFVNVDPNTGERHPNFEPLKTLNDFRKLIPSEGPIMGLLLALRNPGYISIGDDVYIGDESKL